MKMAENMNQTQTQTIITKSGKILDPQQMHVCRLCDKLLSSSSSLDRHMLTHSGERPFVCKRCHMTFTTNGNMHRHMRTHLHKDSLARQQQEQMQLKQSLLVAGGNGNSSSQLLGQGNNSANSSNIATGAAFSYSATTTTNSTAATSQHNQLANQHFGQHHQQQPPTALTNNPLASLIACNINAARHQNQQNHQNPVTALLNQQLLAAAFQQQQQKPASNQRKHSGLVHASNQEVSTTFHQNHLDISSTNQLHHHLNQQQQRQALLVANQMMQTTPMDQKHHLDPKALMMSAAALAAANQADGSQNHQASLESMKTMMLAAAAAAAAAAAMNQDQQQQQQESSEQQTSNFSQDLMMELPNSQAIERASPAPDRVRGKRRKQVNPLRSSGQSSSAAPTSEHVAVSNCSNNSPSPCSSSPISDNALEEVGQMDDVSSSSCSSSGRVNRIMIKTEHESNTKREDFNNNNQSASSSPNTSAAAVYSERENESEKREIEVQFDRVEMAPSEVDYDEEKLYDAGDNDEDRRQTSVRSDKGDQLNVRPTLRKEQFHPPAHDNENQMQAQRGRSGERSEQQQVKTAADARDLRGDSSEGPPLGRDFVVELNPRFDPCLATTMLSENEFSDDEHKFREGVALKDTAEQESDQSQHSDSGSEIMGGAMSENSRTMSSGGRMRKRRRRDFVKLSPFDTSSSSSSISRKLKRPRHQITDNDNNLDDTGNRLVNPNDQNNMSLFNSTCAERNNNINELNIVASQERNNQDQSGPVTDDEDGEVVEDVSQSYVKTANPNATRKGGKRNRHCYKCKLCTYSSVDRCTLVRHLRIHSGERPYICGICRYAFTTKANCERHVRKRHKKQYNSLGGSGGVKGSNGGGRSLIITDHSNHQTIPVKVSPQAAQTISQTLQRIQEKEQQQHHQQQQQQSVYENVGPNRLDGSNQQRAHESANIERIGDRKARAMSNGSTRSSGNKRKHRQVDGQDYHSMTVDGELSSSVHRGRRLASKLHKSTMNDQRTHQASNFNLAGTPRLTDNLYTVCNSDPLLSAASLGKQPGDLFMDQVQMQSVVNNFMGPASAKTSSTGDETGADLANNNQTGELFVNLLAQIQSQMNNNNNNNQSTTGFTMQSNPAQAISTTSQCGESISASMSNANFLANMLAAGKAMASDATIGGTTPQEQPTALIEQLNSLLSSKHLSQQLRNLNIQNPFFNRRNPFDPLSSIDIAQALDLSCKLQTHK